MQDLEGRNELKKQLYCCYVQDYTVFMTAEQEQGHRKLENMNQGNIQPECKSRIRTKSRGNRWETQQKQIRTNKRGEGRQDNRLSK